MQIITSYSPFELLYVDFSGKYPKTARRNTMVYMAKCHFTGWIELGVGKTSNVRDYADFLIERIYL